MEKIPNEFRDKRGGKGHAEYITANENGNIQLKI